MIANYDKTRRIVWTPETTAAFHEMKLQVSKCSTMHFMSDTAPITLHTNASDYGMGGYLFRTVDGIDQPVAFVSKSLNMVSDSEGSLWNISFMYVLTIAPA